MYTDINQIDLEENVVGSIMLGHEELLENLKLEYFENRHTQEIIKTAFNLSQRGCRLGEKSILAELKQNNSDIGINKLADLVINASTWEAEGNIKQLRDLWKKRESIKILAEGLRSLNSDSDIENLNIDIAHKLDQLMFEDKIYEDDAESIIKRLRSELTSKKSEEEMEKYKYGIYPLDRMTLGLHPEELTTIAAKSGVGKTAFVLQIAERLINNNLKVLIISREMSEEQNMKRILVRRTGISSNKFRNKTFTEREWNVLDDTFSDLSSKNLFINTEISKVLDIKKRMRKIKPDVLIIDYLQLLTSDSKEQNREREVATISREIKALTSDFGIPIIQLSQLNDENRDSRPKGERVMRESKAIYQNSNNVIYLHIPDTKEINKYINEGKLTINELRQIKAQGNEVVEIILDKQRDGETGSFLQQYVKSKLQFAPLDYCPDFYPIEKGKEWENEKMF